MTTLSPAFLEAQTAKQQSAMPKQERAKELARSYGQWLPSSRMLVTPARLIIGRDLTDEAGDSAGTIKFLMIRMGTGDIIYAVASSDAYGQFIPVPWNAINAEDWTGWRTTGLSLELSAQELQETRRFEMEDLHRLTSPITSKEVTTKYGVADITPPLDDGEGVLVFGIERSGTISPPATQLDNQIVGSTVKTSNGQTIGEIDEVVVDVSDGKVPYVLVSQDGFLGSGGRWIPIPPQALQWNAGDGGYTVGKTQEELKKLPVVDRPSLPASIRRSDLNKLFDFYGLKPRWVEGEAS